MAIQESGHDTTARLTRTDACDMATVDLNCILYRIESDLASKGDTTVWKHTVMIMHLGENN